MFNKQDEWLKLCESRYMLNNEREEANYVLWVGGQVK